MSKDNFTFDDIDDILADFYKSYNEAEKRSAEVKAAPAAETKAPVRESAPAARTQAPAKAERESFDFSGAAGRLNERKAVKDEAIDFSGAAERLRVQSREKARPAAEPAPAAKPVEAPKPMAEAAEQKARARAEKTESFRTVNEKAAASSRNAGSSLEEFDALFSRKSVAKDADVKRSPIKRETAPAKDEDPMLAEMFANKGGKKKAVDFTAKKAKAEKQPKAKKEKAPKPEKQPKAKPEMPVREEAYEAAPVQAAPRKKFSPLHALLSMVFGCVSVFALCWVLFNVHPASGTVSTAGDSAVLKLSDKLDVYMNNVASDALGELSFIKKIYTLQESDTVAPVPNPDGFGVTRDVAVIQDVIKRAAPLLEGQSVVFDPNADFVPDTDFRYYLDDTIMVIAWKEYINERCCTMAEVKVAHGSQLRRKLAEDSYSSSVQYYASDMANASNAVIAINGDFYAFRDLGITVYQRKLYRNNPASVDSCFFTADGNMLFSRAGELMGEGETQQFIEDNDVLFAVAFGPILVENGELQYCASYPIGEINTEYSRSCIGMTDDLHYLLMTINHTPDARPRATINDLARYIYSKGVVNAYTLDGGQTAEIVMMGGPINHVDFGFERTVSDIIYFATAIPNEEVSQ